MVKVAENIRILDSMLFGAEDATKALHEFMAKSKEMADCPGCGEYRDTTKVCPNPECRRLPGNVIHELTREPGHLDLMRCPMCSEMHDAMKPCPKVGCPGQARAVHEHFHPRTHPSPMCIKAEDLNRCPECGVAWRKGTSACCPACKVGRMSFSIDAKDEADAVSLGISRTPAKEVVMEVHDIDKKAQAIVARYGVTAAEAAIAVERQKVYGDPKVNHDGIAAAWAGLLEPHLQLIAEGKPIPAWTVALMLVSLKVNRCRNVFHEDNYDDIAVYLGFAKTWQQEDEENKDEKSEEDG